MKFIAKNLNHPGLLWLTGFAVAAAGLYFGTPQKARAAASISRHAPPVVGKTEAQDGCGGGKPVAPVAPVATTGCPHRDTTTNAAPATATGCCPHQ
jgi:hypothetical protein